MDSRIPAFFQDNNTYTDEGDKQFVYKLPNSDIQIVCFIFEDRLLFDIVYKNYETCWSMDSGEGHSISSWEECLEKLPEFERLILNRVPEAQLNIDPDSVFDFPEY
jgi:hypothetical protein